MFLSFTSVAQAGACRRHVVLFVHLSSFTKIHHKCITSAVFIGAFSILPDRLGAHLYVPITVRLHRGYTRPRNWCRFQLYQHFGRKFLRFHTDCAALGGQILWNPVETSDISRLTISRSIGLCILKLIRSAVA